jgi:hypothetical protein
LHNYLEPETAMTARHKWIIVLVAYDDPDIEARVIKERLPEEVDDQLAALLRGGALVAVIECDNESVAEAQRVEVERSCLR